MNKVLNVGLVWANPYSGNMGVNALSYSAVYIVWNAAKKLGLNVNIVLLGTHREGTDTLQIGEASIDVITLERRHYHGRKFLLKYFFCPKLFGLSTLKSLDVVMDISEGDSFTDIYAQNRFNMFLGSKDFFNARGVTQVLLPQTIGPFNDPDNERRAFQTMKKMRTLLPRDKYSSEYARLHLPDASVKELIDLAFFLPYEETHYESDYIHVGINVSALLWNGGYTKNNQFGLKANYRNVIIGVIEFMLQEENVIIHLVPHVVPENQPVEDDYEVSKELQQRFPELRLADRFRSPIEAKSYISGLDFFAGARMHACIAAYSAGVTVYPMAYSRKFSGLFMETLNYQSMGDCVNQTTDELLNGFVLLFNNRESAKRAIAESLEKTVKPRMKMLSDSVEEVLLHVHEQYR